MIVHKLETNPMIIIPIQLESIQFGISVDQQLTWCTNTPVCVVYWSKGEA